MGNPKTQTTTQSNAPPAGMLQAYFNLLGRAGGVADTPYTPYGGPLTAGMDPLQQGASWGTTIGAQNILTGALPGLDDARGFARDAAGPITADEIAHYTNPYTDDVVRATQADFAHGNQVQQQGVISNAIKSGNAFGGDRMGIAQAELAGAQDRAQAPVIAGLRSQGYTQALTAAQQDAARQAQAAGLFGGLAGTQAGIGSGINTVANSQFGMGTVAQQTQQAGLNAAYQQFLQQQAYPFQTTGWLGNILGSLGTASGGTGTTTSPGPSVLGQVLGAGATGAGILGALGGSAGGLSVLAALRRGGRVPHLAAGGVPYGMASPYNAGAMPYGNAQMSFVPDAMAEIIQRRGLGPPKPPSPVAGEDFAKSGMDALLKLSGTASKRLPGGINGPANILPTNFGASPVDSMVDMGASPAMSPMGPLYARGGGIGHFADGGVSTRHPEGLREEFSDWLRERGLPASGQFDDLHANPVGMAAIARGGADMPPSIRVRQGFRAIDERTRARGGIAPHFADGGFPEDPVAARFPYAGDFPVNPALYEAREAIRARGMENLAGRDAPIAGIVPIPRPRPQTDLPPSDYADITPTPVRTSSIMRPDAAPAEGPALGYTDEPPRAGLSLPPVAAPAPTNGAPQVERNMLGVPTSRATAMDSPWMGLAMAGLGMLSSKSPFAGTAIGEGGLAGLNYMNQVRNRERDLDAKQQIDHSGPTTRIFFPSTGQWIDTGVPTMTASQNVQRQLTERQIQNTERHQKETERLLQEQRDYQKTTPVKIGTDAWGGDRFGIRDPNNPGQFLDPVTMKPLKDAAPSAMESIVPGDDKTLPKENGALIKKIANYEIDPRTLSTKGGHREKLLAAAAAYRPDYDFSNAPARVAAVKDFSTGKKGDAIRSFDVAIDHLHTLRELGRALDNGDVRLVNAMRNKFKEQFGYDAPGNFDAAKGIVGDEVVKAILGSGNSALADREEMKKPLNNANSWTQLSGVIDKAFLPLMAGQLKGYRKQYEDTTGRTDFDKRLSPAALRELTQAQHGTTTNSSSAAPTATGPDGKKLILRDGKWVPLQ